MDMLTKIVVAFVIGAFMGVLTHAKRYKTIKKPKNNRTTFYPGVLLDMAFGAVAAVAGVLIADPGNMGRLIIIAIAAGVAGENFVMKLDIDKNQHNLNNAKAIENQLDTELDEPKQIP